MGDNGMGKNEQTVDIELRIDIVLRDPVTGRIYKKKNSPMDCGVKDMYSFVAMKYQGEKKRQQAIINRDMQKRE